MGDKTLWDVRYRDVSVDVVKPLYNDLLAAEKLILDFAPSTVNIQTLRRNHIRVFKFSRREQAHELFLRRGRKTYVCLNAALLKRKYWAGLQFLIHGISHSFCYLRDDIAQEVFCEHVGYSITDILANAVGIKFSRRIMQSIVRASHPSYRIYYRAARRLDGRNPNMICELNSKARYRGIAKHLESKIVRRALKARRVVGADNTEVHIELEKGFRKL